MAQSFVTGPVGLFAGVGSGNNPVFIGHSERGFRVEIRGAWEGLFNDLRGSRIAYDQQWMGEEAFIFGDLTRWNEPGAYAALQSRPNFLGTRGTNAAAELGTLMQTEGFAYPLWLQAPYSSLKAAYSTQPPGWRFLSCWMEGPDVLEPLGTVASKRRLIFHALGVLTIVPGNVVTSVLYDANMAGLPAIN